MFEILVGGNVAKLTQNFGFHFEGISDFVFGLPFDHFRGKIISVNVGVVIWLNVAVIGFAGRFSLIIGLVFHLHV